MKRNLHKFSIVIPILNEGKNIEGLAKKISKTLKKIIFEIIFIDDNSNDNTLEILKKITKKKNLLNTLLEKKTLICHSLVY